MRVEIGAREVIYAMIASNIQVLTVKEFIHDLSEQRDIPSLFQINQNPKIHPLVVKNIIVKDIIFPPKISAIISNYQLMQQEGEAIKRHIATTDREAEFRYVDPIEYTLLSNQYKIYKTFIQSNDNYGIFQ